MRFRAVECDRSPSLLAFVLATILFLVSPLEAATLHPGDLLVADHSAAGGGGALILLDPQTGAQTVISSGGSFVEPYWVALATNGDLYISDVAAAGGNGGIYRIDAATGVQTAVSTGGSFVDPSGIAFDSNGDLLVADQSAFGLGGGIIRVNVITGTQTTVSSGGYFVNPHGILVGSNGDIYVADYSAFGGNGGVIRVNPTTGAQTVVASGGNFNVAVGPVGLAFLSNGDLAVSDYGGSKVIRVDPTSGAQSVISSGGSLVNPIGIAIAPNGDLLVVDRNAFGSGGVIRIDQMTGVQSAGLYNQNFVDPDGAALVPGTATTLNDLTVAGPMVIMRNATFHDVAVPSSMTLVVNAELTATGNMTIQSGGLVTHSGRLLTGLALNVAGTLDVQSGGLIDLNGKGLLGGGNGSAFGLSGEAFNGSGAIVAGATTGSLTAAGASHGGPGANGESGCLANAGYGRLEDAQFLGSGGGGKGGGVAGGHGGGRATITAGTGLINGTVRANGGAGTVYTASAGGGSGGSLRLSFGTLSGNGAIEAIGGNASGVYGGVHWSGSGGGGRIAIYYDTSTFPLADISARGGNVGYWGAPGTIYLKDNAQPKGDLIVDGKGVAAGLQTALQTALDAFNGIVVGNGGILSAASAYGPPYAVDHLQVNSGGVLNQGMDLTLPIGSELQLSGTGAIHVLSNSVFTVGHFDATNVQSGTFDLQAGSRLEVGSGSATVGNGVTLIKDGTFGTSDQIGAMTIQSGGLVTHSGRLLTGLVLNVAGTLDVQSGGAINLQGRGLLGGANGSTFGLRGEALDNSGVIVAGASAAAGNGAGGSYGGLGGSSTAGAATNLAYGLLEDPRQLGAGGGTSTFQSFGAGNGGGRATITATDCVINGTLQANGGNGAGGGSSATSGAGSGGAIRLSVSGALSGSGTIQAIGGFAACGAGGCSGSGGGGRIAIYYGTTTFPLTNLGARGANAASFGNAGTIYLKDNAQPRGDLIVDNGGGMSGRETGMKTALASFGSITLRNGGILAPVSSDIVAFTVDHLHVNSNGTLNQKIDLNLPLGSELDLNGGVINVLNGATFTLGYFDPTNAQSGTCGVGLGGRLVLPPDAMTVGGGVTFVKDGSLGTNGDQIHSLTIASGGVITHSPRLIQGLALNVSGTLNIQPGGAIDVSAMGLKGGQHGSVFPLYAETFSALDDVVQGASGTLGTAAGGSFGGLGGTDHAGGGLGAVYGDPEDPRYLGSGGGTLYTIDPEPPGGNGGGLASISVGTCIVDGAIRANGGAGVVTTYTTGGGSGGSIRLMVGSLNGAGVIEARGGGSFCDGNGCSGAGGGGRISVRYASSSFPQSNITAVGGVGGRPGHAGSVFVLDLSQIKVVPSHAGNSGSSTLTVYGVGLDLGAQVQLARSSSVIATAVVTAPAADGSSLMAAFDLSGLAPGAADVVVRTSGGLIRSAPGGFTIDAGGESNVWVQVLSRSLVLANSPSRYVLMYGNSGNTDATMVPISIRGFPTNSVIHNNFTLDEFPGTSGSAACDTCALKPFSPENDGAVTVNQCAFIEGLLPAGATRSISMDVRMTPQTAPALERNEAGNVSDRDGVRSLHQPPLGPTGAEWLDYGCAQPNCIALTPSRPPSSCSDWTKCILAAANSAAACLGPLLAAEFGPAGGACVVAAVNTNLQPLLQICNAGAQPGKFLQDGVLWPFATAIATCLQQAGLGTMSPSAIVGLLKSCTGALGGQWDSCRHDTPKSCVCIVQAVDPNDLRGPEGAGSMHFISGNARAAYTIYFENEPDATAPAYDVVITCPIDTTRFDPTAFALGAITFGDSTISVPPEAATFARDVDLRPGKNLIVRVRARFDRVTGMATWTFISIDPVTGLPVDDPLLGFLPPNHTPVEGEGSVNFSILPRVGLPTGSQIQEVAEITFDSNAPISTPTWSIALDNDPPTSTMSMLPATSDTGRIALRWHGTDVGSGVKEFSILVSKNGGPFVVWREGASDTADTYIADTLATYAFMSIARDSAGIVEGAKGQPDAQITLTNLLDAPRPQTKPLVFALRGMMPNPGDSRVHIAFELPSWQPASLSLFDIAGRRIAQREVGSLGPGAHYVDLGDQGTTVGPGIYYVRMRQGTQVATKKIVVVH